MSLESIILAGPRSQGIVSQPASTDEDNDADKDSFTDRSSIAGVEEAKQAEDPITFPRAAKNIQSPDRLATPATWPVGLRMANFTFRLGEISCRRAAQAFYVRRPDVDEENTVNKITAAGSQKDQDPGQTDFFTPSQLAGPSTMAMHWLRRSIDRVLRYADGMWKWTVRLILKPLSNWPSVITSGLFPIYSGWIPDPKGELTDIRNADLMQELQTSNKKTARTESLHIAADQPDVLFPYEDHGRPVTVPDEPNNEYLQSESQANPSGQPEVDYRPGIGLSSWCEMPRQQSTTLEDRSDDMCHRHCRQIPLGNQRSNRNLAPQ